jgi:hypothetical protein
MSYPTRKYPANPQERDNRFEVRAVLADVLFEALCRMDDEAPQRVLDNWWEEYAGEDLLHYVYS